MPALALLLLAPAPLASANHTCASAFGLARPADTETGHLNGPGDIDYWRISLQASETLVVALNKPLLVNMNVHVRDAACGAWFTSGNAFTFRPVRDGAYTLEVHAHDAGGDYRLVTAVLPTDAAVAVYMRANLLTESAGGALADPSAPQGLAPASP